MAFTENIPESFTNPSQDQVLIKDNFTAINESFNINHKGFNDPNKGKHTVLQMPEQTLVPTTSADEMALYTKQSTRTSKAEMFIRRESSGLEVEFTSFLGGATGWTRLPSGILLKWGSGGGNGPIEINFQVSPTIPPFIATYTAFVQAIDTSSTPNTFATFRTVTTTTLKLYGSSRTNSSATDISYNYLVIGS